MTYRGPSEAWLVVGGKNLSTETYSFEETVESLLEMTRGIGPTEVWDRYKPVGLGRITLEPEAGLYDDDQYAIIDAFKNMGETQQIVGYGLDGLVIGQEAVQVDGAFIANFSRIIAREGLTRANGAYTITAEYMRGRIVHGLAVETGDPWTSEATSVDQALARRLPVATITANTLANPTVVTSVGHGLVTGEVILISGSNSTPTIDGERVVTVIDPDTFSVPVNVTVAGTAGTFIKVSTIGAVVDLHVLALDLGGYTNLVVTPLHSADDVVFVSMGSSFAAVTTAGVAERKVFAGQIERYVAVSGDFTGAGAGQSVVPLVLVSR